MSFADAFFLHYAVGCLDIFVDDVDHMSIIENGTHTSQVTKDTLSRDSNGNDNGKNEFDDHNAVFTVEHSTAIFRTFCRLQSTFIESYAALCHYRSLGWFLRSGLQFGSTYVMYREHPSVAHSEMCALVACECTSWHRTIHELYFHATLRISEKC